MTTTDEVQAALHQLNSARYAGARATGHPPSSLAEFLEGHARAAVQLSGAGETAWSGQVIEAGEGILGVAHWDGTLHLDRECILEPLREMYSRAGEPQSDAALVRYREALVTVLHEQSHFLGPAGSTQEAARIAFKKPGGRALEEGVAELWAQDHLDAYLDRLGIHEAAPGISEVRSEPSYQAFAPAVRVLTTDLDQRAGLPPGEVLNALNRQTAEGQWNLVVDLAYKSSRLPELVPPDREPAVRLRLETTLRESFSSLAHFQGLSREFAETHSKAIGDRTVQLLTREITAAEASFQPNPSRDLQARATQFPPTLAPPSPSLTTAPNSLATPPTAAVITPANSLAASPGAVATAPADATTSSASSTPSAAPPSSLATPPAGATTPANSLAAPPSSLATPSAGVTASSASSTPPAARFTPSAHATAPARADATAPADGPVTAPADGAASLGGSAEVATRAAVHQALSGVAPPDPSAVTNGLDVSRRSRVQQSVQRAADHAGGRTLR
jgi:hypothetical protein